MVRFEVTEIIPSLPVSGLPSMMLILSPAPGDQEMEGSGTPVAVQVNVTAALPSFSVTVVSAVGAVIVTAAETKEQF